MSLNFSRLLAKNHMVRRTSANKENSVNFLNICWKCIWSEESTIHKQQLWSLSRNLTVAELITLSHQFSVVVTDQPKHCRPWCSFNRKTVISTPRRSQWLDVWRTSLHRSKICSQELMPTDYAWSFMYQTTIFVDNLGF